MPQKTFTQIDIDIDTELIQSKAIVTPDIAK